MGRTKIARDVIGKITQNISQAKSSKEQYSRYLNTLKKRYSQGKISYEKYIEELYKKREGRTLDEWVEYIDRYHNTCKKEIKKQKKTIKRKNVFIIFISAILLISSFAFFSNSFSFTGFAVENPNEAIQNETLILPIKSINSVQIADNFSVSTIQYQAVLGQPVKWNKKINPEESGEIKLTLPRDAQNITVEKIEISYSESEGVLQNGTRPSQEESPSSEEPDILGEEVENLNETFSPLTGAVINKRNSRNFFQNLFGTLTGKATDEGILDTQTEVNFKVEENATYQVEYQTPAPYAIETETEKGKEVKIVGPDSVHYENVLAFTKLDEKLKIDDPSKVKIYWKEENKYLSPEKVEDKDNNGIYDYVEWTVPHLSEQTFEIIIEISNAEHLDSEKNFISDIYEQVKNKDDSWSEEIPEDDYVRITFEKNLTNQNDITLYPRVVSGNPKIEVYEKEKNNTIAEFTSLISNEYNKIFLNNLNDEQDTFDLRVVGGSVEFDHIVDPTVMIVQSAGTMDIGMAPLDNHTLVIAYTNVSTNSVVFEIRDTNGTQVLAPVTVDSTNTAASYARVAVAAYNSTHFIIGWSNLTSYLVAGYLRTGSTYFSKKAIIEGNTTNTISSDNDLAIGGTTLFYCYMNWTTNSTVVNRFNATTGEAIGISTTVISPSMSEAVGTRNLNNSISCDAINSTAIVFAEYNGGIADDVTFHVILASGTEAVTDTDIDTSVGNYSAVAVTGLDSNKFAGTFYDSIDNDITVWVRFANNTAVLAATDIDANVGAARNTTHVAIATVRNFTSLQDNFVVAYTNMTDLVAVGYNYTGGVSMAKFVVDTNISNATFYLVGKKQNGMSLCNGTWTIAYKNDSNAMLFKTYWINGSIWNGTCITPDISLPAINITYPSNNTLTSNNRINVNYTVSDDLGISSCWYSNSSGLVNYTLVSCENITGRRWMQGINNLTIWVNDTSNKVNSSLISFFVENRPKVIITSPYGQQINVGSQTFISVNVTNMSNTNISSVIAEITYPNTSKINLTLSNIIQQLSDNFTSDSMGTSWFNESWLKGPSQKCYANINGISSGKAFTSLTGDGSPETDTYCSIISKKIVDGDFDINISWNIDASTSEDWALNFMLLPTNTSANASRIIYMARSDWTGMQPSYEIFADDGNFSDYILQRSTSDNLGKFRIVRLGNNFTFYTWNAGAWNLETVSMNNFSLPRQLYIGFESESAGNKWGSLNVSWDNLSISGNNFSIGMFGDTSATGVYNIRIFANDTDGNLNNTETTFFRVNQTNSIPSKPYIITPTPNSTLNGIYNITWTTVIDSQGDALKFNITLLNPNLTFNSSIALAYGNSSTNYYQWNSALVPNGNYTLKVEVYEELTPEHYFNYDILNGNCTINNTFYPVNVIINYPLGQDVSNYTQVAISANVSSTAAISSVIAEITYPNTSKTNVTLNNNMQQLSDNFNSDSMETSWFNESFLKGLNQTCRANINSISAGKAFTSLTGDGNPETDTFCSIISKKFLDGDFDINISWSIASSVKSDWSLNFQVTEGNSSANATRLIYFSKSNWTGQGPKYEIFADDGNFSDYILQRTDSNTTGKFRIKRTGNNFLFYTWSGSNWNEEPVSQNNFSIARQVYVGFESESTAPSWGSVNVTWEDFGAITNNYSIGLFGDTVANGTYNVRILANNSLNTLNSTETTYFRVNQINTRPSEPYVIAPVAGEAINGIYTIYWTTVIDSEGDSLNFNITLLNPNRTFNSTIVSAYGDETINSFQWNTTPYLDGNYTLNILVYENATNEKYSNNNTLNGNFTIDNTAPYFINLNQSILLSPGQSLNYTFLANDTGTDSITFGINWTETFSIDPTTGELINTSSLLEGSYFINVSITDLIGNVNSTEFLVNVNSAGANLSNAFSSMWNTSKAGSSNSTTISLPIYSGGNYNFTVYWGDGNSSTVTSYLQNNYTYATAGTYKVDIVGTIIGWRFNNGGDKDKIQNINQWGRLNVGNNQGYFYGCTNLNSNATDALNLTGTTYLTSMFAGATSFNGNISNWNTSNVIDLSVAFLGASSFNQNINNWNTSNVISLYNTFSLATSFNQNLTNWDTHNVNNMQETFFGANSFNGNISNWNTSNVVNMGYTFQAASSFNQSINNWDTSEVTNFEGMFQGATSFNQNISRWDTHNATTMAYMFDGATSFNQDLGNWNVSSATTLEDMFKSITLSTLNYDSILHGWASRKEQNGTIFSGGNSKYSNCAGTGNYSRNILINTYNWSITDGGFNSTYVCAGDTTAPLINFTLPTPSNVTITSNTSVLINVSISTSSLANLTYNWNGTNYSLYNNNLVLMYNFDNLSALGENSTYVADLSKYGNNGTVLNGALFNSSGKYGGTYQFDGVNDYINLSSLPNVLNFTNFTASFWINPNQPNDDAMLMELFDYDGWSGWAVSMNMGGGFGCETGNICVWIGNASLKGSYVNYNYTFPTKAWTHLAVTYDYGINNVSFFINGNLVSSRQSAYTLNMLNIVETKIGGWSWASNSYFNGSLDEVRIYNKSLSASEIYQQYVSNLQKFNSTQWYLQVNQSKNLTDGLSAGNYTYKTYAVDSSGNLNSTETRIVTINVSETAPIINYIQPVSATNPTESSTSVITFNFTAYDANGANTLNDSSASAYFQRTGQTTRYNASCVNGSTVGNTKNYTCTVRMWYFDQAGAWTINTTVKDNTGLYNENASTTFTYNLLTSMVVSPSVFGWPTINLSSINIGANNNPAIINNTGNAENLNVNVTAYNLIGETTSSQYIPAINFSVDNITSGCLGSVMINATDARVTNSTLQRGNNSIATNNSASGQTPLYFCLRSVPNNIGSQSYSSGTNSWIIRIFLIAAIPAGRKRKKNIAENDKLVRAFNLIAEELKEEYSLNKKELLEIIEEKLKDKYTSPGKEIGKEAGQEIPISVFSTKLGYLEAITKYMKENLQMTYRAIGKILGRDERTIWTSYKKAKEKIEEKFNNNGELTIPIIIFENKELTIFESLILYLRDKGMKYSEIGVLLNRDQRNIWTVYSRIKNKNDNV
jgi:surface protein